MADDAGQGERTEAATPRRLQRAREEGQIPVSREVSVLASMAAVTLALMLAGPAVVHDMALRLSVFLARAHEFDLHGGSAFRLAGLAWMRGAAPFVLAAMLAGVAAVMVQTRFAISLKALHPQFKRVSPGGGLKRLLGANSAVEAGKSLAKVTVLSFATWQVLKSDVSSLMLAPYEDPREILLHATRPVLHVLLMVLAVQAVIAGVDFIWVFLRHTRGLRMSRHDIQEENKETEGDPRIKARIKQIRFTRARRRMLAAVPKATVVITNPTHYAVALSYDRAKHTAPRVVAKGVDSLAARIREVADASHVPIVVNPPLARALHRVDLDTDIPPEQYKAVAEIIAYVWRLGRRTQGVAA